MGLFLIITVTLVLMLLAGIILTVLTTTWRPQAGKGLFLAFVVSLFLVLPVFLLGAMGLTALLENHRDYRFRDGIAYFSMGFVFLDFIIAMGLLIAYAIARQSGDVEMPPIPGTYQRRPRAIWNTAISSRESIHILRRREWAFLIELAPAILLIVLLFGIVAKLDAGGSMNRQWGWMIDFFSTAILITVVILVPIYMLFKDSFQGVSIGKKLTGCRVVDFTTGRPIGADKSMLRNAIFLIPFLALIELVVASFRSDRRRLGDLLANTIVVQGSPVSVDGVPVVVTASPVDLQSAAKAAPKHPLDD